MLDKRLISGAGAKLSVAWQVKPPSLSHKRQRPQSYSHIKHHPQTPQQKKGKYTQRYAIQIENDDHYGVSKKIIGSRVRTRAAPHALAELVGIEHEEYS